MSIHTDVTHCRHLTAARRLQDYAPASPAEAIIAPLTAAVAHLRLFRTFQILLDPSKSVQHPKQPITETLAPLLTACVAAYRHRSPRMWLCVSAIDPHEFPSSHTAEQHWSEKVLNMIWEAAATGACPCGAFFDPSGTLHEAALAGAPTGERGAEEVTCMHVVLGGASGYSPGLARCLGRFMAAQMAILRLRAIHRARVVGEAQGPAAGAGGAAPGSPAVTAAELAELAAASHALEAEISATKDAAELATAAARIDSSPPSSQLNLTCTVALIDTRRFKPPQGAASGTTYCHHTDGTQPLIPTDAVELYLKYQVSTNFQVSLVSVIPAIMASSARGSLPQPKHAYMPPLGMALTLLDSARQQLLQRATSLQNTFCTCCTCCACCGRSPCIPAVLAVGLPEMCVLHATLAVHGECAVHVVR